MTTTQQRPLTRAELLRIAHAIRASRDPHTDAILTIFETHPEWADATSFNPNDVRVPQRQLHRIMDWAKAAETALEDTSDIGTVNRMLTWVNVGPSSYEDDVLLGGYGTGRYTA